MLRLARTAALAAVMMCVVVPAAAAKQRSEDRLEVYTAVVSPQKLGEIEAQGLDVASSEPAGSNMKAQLILTADQRARLNADGVKTELTRVKGGKTVKHFAAA